MATTRTCTVSFNGGEVTPEFWGRIDDAKYQAGAARMRNFIVLPHGPAANRAGFAFVRAAKYGNKKCRVIPFSYSTTQAMALEIGDQYVRFHTGSGTVLAGTPVAYNGATAYIVGDMVTSAGTVYYCKAGTTGNAPPNATYWYAQPATGEYEIPTPYLEADLFKIHYVQSNDVLTLVHDGYAPMELRRQTSTTGFGLPDGTFWKTTAIAFGEPITAPTAPTVTVAGLTTAKYNYTYVVTSVGTDGIGESKASRRAFGVQKVITGATQANPCVITSVAHALAEGDVIYISAVGGMTQLNAKFYRVGTVLGANTFNLLNEDGTNVNSTAYGAYTAGGTADCAFIKGNLFETGCTNTVAWTAVSGAAHYRVYRLSGGLFGYIGQTSGTSLVDDNIEPDIAYCPPDYSTTFSAAGDYPAAVAYFEQRRCFAGTRNKPSSVWMTRSGTESDLGSSIPVRDDDSVQFRVAAREYNAIRHIAPLGSMVLLTNAAEWSVSSQSQDGFVPSVKPQSYIGASDVQPVVVNNSLLYAAARGGHVRELAYSWQANGIVTGDLSIRAPHLFDHKTIVDMAFSKSPYPICWAVNDEGLLLGCTYLPEETIGAWHWHDTDGLFESVTVASDGTYDATYAVVQRTINGATVRYIERMGSRKFDEQADAFFVDAGGTYSGAPATTISGATWLEGETVSILADGAVHPPRVVTGGAFTLDNAASVVQFGLPIEADLQTLPLGIAMRVDSSFGQGRPKNINKAWLRVYRSGGIFIGPTEDELTEAKQRTDEDYGSPPRLKSDEVEITTLPAWDNSGGQLLIRQADPLPLTVLSLTLEVALGG